MDLHEGGPIVANDNVRHAGDFASCADRREWLSTLPDDTADVLAWPTLERLAHKRDAARTSAHI